MEKKPCSSQDPEVRKGPWTVEEDIILMNYIAKHGEGVWDSLAKAAGLKRTGKSCRLRWLNYLRPDVRRGNITPEEQLLIMELHATWGNKWSKIAKHLPGRTDNEIKNFWRTKVQKHAHVKEGSASHASSQDQAVDSQATTSQVSNMEVEHQQLVEPNYTLPSSYQPYPSSDTPLPPPPQASDPLNEVDTAWWTEEDFWCMQLFNGD